MVNHWIKFWTTSQNYIKSSKTNPSIWQEHMLTNCRTQIRKTRASMLLGYLRNKARNIKNSLSYQTEKAIRTPVTQVLLLLTFLPNPNRYQRWLSHTSIRIFRTISRRSIMSSSFSLDSFPIPNNRQKSPQARDSLQQTSQAIRISFSKPFVKISTN